MYAKYPAMTHNRNIYVTDLDGTLLNHESRVSDRSREILDRLSADGTLITVATARTPATVDNLLSGIRLRLPAIVMTGAATWDLTAKRYHHKHMMDPGLCAAVERVCSGHGITPFRYTLGHEGMLDVFHLSPRGRAGMNRAEQSFYEERSRLKLKKFHFEPPADNAFGDTILYLGLAPTDDVNRAAEELRAMGITSVSAYPDIFNPAVGTLEIYADGVSKASAVSRLREAYGGDRLTVFGDNLNDIPMMRVADVAVAVENALPQVKEAADIVIGPNTTDSVARYIEQDCARY